MPRNGASNYWEPRTCQCVASDFEHRLVDYLDVNPESRTRLPPAVKTPAARSFDARLLIAAAPGGPAEADDRGSFARTSFAEIGGIRDVRITRGCLSGHL